MQEAARRVAISGPNNLGLDPNHPGQQLANVPNGLGLGGLQVAPKVPVDLNHPAAGTATNTGLIDSPRANTTIAGRTVNQFGAIESPPLLMARKNESEPTAPAPKARTLTSGIEVWCSFEKLVPVEEIKPNPRNPNTARSLRRTRVGHPIPVDQSLVLLATAR